MARAGRDRFSCCIDKKLDCACILPPKAPDFRLINSLKRHTFGWIFGKYQSNYKVEWRVDALTALNHCCRRVTTGSVAPRGARQDFPNNGLRAL
jgi:hypothetical protein